MDRVDRWLGGQLLTLLLVSRQLRTAGLVGGQMFRGTLVLGGHMVGGKVVRGDSCPTGTFVLWGQLS